MNIYPSICKTVDCKGHISDCIDKKLFLEVVLDLRLKGNIEDCIDLSKSYNVFKKTQHNRVLQIGTRFILPFPNMVSKIIEIVTRLAIQIHTTYVAL